MTLHPSGATEPEISHPTDLTHDGKRLNPEAIGWATQPIIDTSKLQRGVGRNKRWEYWNVSTPTHILALTVSHIDYACVPEVWVYERATGTTWAGGEAVIPARGSVLAPTLETGPSHATTKHLKIRIEEETRDGMRGSRLRAKIHNVSFDVFAELPRGHERLALVVPWSDTRFQYTVKDVARPAYGALVIDGTTHEVPRGSSWAVLDHGRGRWPYDIAWNWAAGSGEFRGTRIGIQVGAKWTEGTGVSENAFFVDGIMHKIHDETKWQYDIERWREPWRITGGGLDATFTPFYNKQSRMNFVVLSGRTDQCFGVWSGTFTTATGDVIPFDGIEGFAEEVHNRW